MALLPCSSHIIFHPMGHLNRYQVALRFLARCVPRFLELENEDCSNFMALAPRGGEVYIYGAMAQRMADDLLHAGNWAFELGDPTQAPVIDSDTVFDAIMEAETTAAANELAARMAHQPAAKATLHQPSVN